MGYDTTSGEDIAIKLDLKSKHLENEYTIYKAIGNYIGVPCVKWFGEDHSRRALVLSLLGPSLEDIFVESGCNFKLKTILATADQLVCVDSVIYSFLLHSFSCLLKIQLCHLEFIHSRHIVHCDIKPENILLGRGSSIKIFHLINFGLAQQFRDPRTYIHAPLQRNQPLVGTTRYASK